MDIENCPIRKSVKILGGKWSLIIIAVISASSEPLRFNELRRSIPDISEKMLIQTLRTLVKHKYIKRKDYKTIPPKVEYSIKPKGTISLKIIDLFKELEG